MIGHNAPDAIMWDTFAPVCDGLRKPVCRLWHPDREVVGVCSLFLVKFVDL